MVNVRYLLPLLNAGLAALIHHHKVVVLWHCEQKGNNLVSPTETEIQTQLRRYSMERKRERQGNQGVGRERERERERET